MTHEEVGFGVIGLGRMGLQHALNISQRVPGAELVAVADSEEEKTRRATEITGAREYYTEYESLLERPDVSAVCVVTPTATHAKIVVSALDAGKDVFCEKPIAVKIRDAKEVVKKASETGRKLMVGFMRRFDEPYIHAKKRIDEGAIGKPVLFRSNSWDPFPPPAWACDPAIGGGLPVEMHIHDYDLGRWLVGAEVQRVFAEGEALVFKEIKEKIPQFVDNIAITLRFRDGSLGTITGSLNAKYGYDIRTEVLGSEGAVMVGELQRLPVTVCTSRGIAREATYRGNEEPHFFQRFDQAYLNEMRYFTKCVRESEHPSPSGRDGLVALEIANAVMQSLRTGKPVQVG